MRVCLDIRAATMVGRSAVRRYAVLPMLVALIPLCPEVEGGLTVPHAPCELRKTPDGVRAISIDGIDCTAQYEAGARIAVEKAQSSGARVAILKSKSPSCGCGTVFDGTFSGTLREGWGIAAAALRDVGVRVIDENHVTNL